MAGAGRCQRALVLRVSGEVRASESHKRLVSRRGTGSVLGPCGGRTGNQESIEEAEMKVQGGEELGPGLQEAEERAGGTSWVLGAKDGGGAKTAQGSQSMTR